MDRNLGSFTCYGIEDVFDHLGEERINQRIVELKEKPTGSIGISLKDFTYGNPEYSYYNGKGVLWVFSSLIQWFNDIEFVQFLYEKSKKYDKDNYHNTGLLKNKWNDYIELQNEMIKKYPNACATYEVNKLNPYWVEFHFFYSQVFKAIINEELIGNYINNFKKISERMEKDFCPNLVSNGVMWAIYDYYNQKDNAKQANEIAKLNNTYLNIWREIPEDDEEENEEEVNE